MGTTFTYSSRVIERILDRVLVWAEYSENMAIFKQNEIGLGIEECFRELSAFSNRFAVRPIFLSFFHVKRNAFHFDLPLDSINYGG